jgi:hypothetical protein
MDIDAPAGESSAQEFVKQHHFDFRNAAMPTAGVSSNRFANRHCITELGIGIKEGGAPARLQRHQGIG